MKDRIKQYIDYKGITAGELAVLLDVQRSNISHILNGRNKPGAALIEKLLIVFPDLNARWLLTGKGNMNEESTGSTATEQVTPSLFTKKEAAVEVESEPVEVAKKEVSTGIPILDSTDDVEKMILLYKDGTFASFTNRNKI